MPVLKKCLKQHLILISFTMLLSGNLAMAATDTTMQDSFVKARIKSHQQNTDHSVHVEPSDKSLDFHGIFYGYLPCKDCSGIKSTLSLKNNNNYLLVTQPAKESSREFYEKGKYTWNEEKHTVILTPRNKADTRQYLIKDEGTLILLNTDGSKMKGDDEDSYALRSSDTVKSREIHFH
ncbi:copper resistance protein NlpE [Methylobacter sp. S3L5C]|uniref:copper resistance protein NlpE n=1 Tax=Methylobacter sp. S3L5C TaxID=2839024 RepID=UPI001FAC6C64|nr:copper resistance protein NlpE [Methylobacter sp. S3L5C]UOA09095.1 copper resistance protein NlpE [Methylobacter sp. S3L5C]